ncbi:hypothetical protein K458DRAFT_182953 [Lentithecium fluviatile CBS 122367]|uniref:Uncharacterized protein n=1 Tax=Lentithecium fluviatile CBS 122367 TaxID=1168545 RepID=A0A6G1IE97_9PLEO|nr:hypothetical protein K458DRAFT_182953 [Lentithecium fluviatile CBS 122367]
MNRGRSAFGSSNGYVWYSRECWGLLVPLASSPSSMAAEGKEVIIQGLGRRARIHREFASPRVWRLVKYTYQEKGSVGMLNGYGIHKSAGCSPDSVVYLLVLFEQSRFRRGGADPNTNGRAGQ